MLLIISDFLHNHTLTNISIAIFVCLIALWPKYRQHWQRHIWKATANIPGPRQLPIIGNLYLFTGSREKLFQLFRNFSKTYRKRFKLWMINICVIFLKHPDDVQKLFSNPHQVRKNRWLYDAIMGQFVNKGLLTVEVHRWKPQRKMLSHAFSTVKSKDYLITSYKWIDHFINDLKSKPSEFVSDLEYVNIFSLAAVCENILGWKFELSSSDYQDYTNALLKCHDTVTYRSLRPWFYNQALFDITPKGRETVVTNYELHKLANKVISGRLKDWEENSNLEKNDNKRLFCVLDLLIQNKMKIVDMADEVLTFIIAGNDTTRNTIQYLFLVLASMPKIQKRIYEEIQAVSDDKDYNFDYDDLKKLPYLEMCIKETLRLYPSIPMVLRDLVEDLELDDVTLPAGIPCIIGIFDLHRNPDFWPNPDVFDPDRFLPENVAARHPYAYLPFGGGPRNCIGKKYAIMTAKAFVCKFLRHYWLEPVDTPEDITFIIDMFLRTKEKFSIRMIRRS